MTTSTRMRMTVTGLLNQTVIQCEKKVQQYVASK